MRLAAPVLIGLAAAILMNSRSLASAEIDLSNATIVSRGDAAANAERTAAVVLQEEIENRTGIKWSVAKEMPKSGAAIVLTSDLKPPTRPGAPELRAEGFRVSTGETKEGAPTVFVVGADARGVLFGVGYLLRHFNATKGKVTLTSPIDVTSSPRYPIRGHQIGYRNRANSWDAWTDRQFEQYFRELAFFGTNAIENIPFQDDDPSPLMKYPRREMNKKMSEICDRYGLEYWVWVPADFDLNDAAKRAKLLDEHETFFKDCPRLDGIFFPGGDPGDNHPKLVLPYIADLAERLKKYHPKAGIWVSLQGFGREKSEYFYEQIAKDKPAWLTGLVCGPGSPPIADTRARLDKIDKKLRLRNYPDITHNCRAEYPVPWWDPAFAFTLGRESTNPEPIYESILHNTFAPYTDGFISYSDGVHDDVNKVLWSSLAWDPDADLRTILADYARLFFGSNVAEEAADGMFALERNWQGPAATNGGIDATLALWKDLEKRAPEQTAKNWRFQQLLMRAYYDVYTRHRLIYETALEDEANAALANAKGAGAGKAMDAATAILNRATTEGTRKDLRERIEQLCEALNQSIQLQTSVPKYKASGTERGAVLDFIAYPLNNRWWLEDEFKKIREFKTEDEKVARLDTIRAWEHPGPGSYYDCVGNVGKSPHVIHGEGINTDPLMRRNPTPDCMWWDNGFSRKRLTWICYMDWPLGLKYEGLDPKAKYTIRLTGYRDSLLKVNGERVAPTIDGKGIGDIKEFPVPEKALEDGKLTLTWDRPVERGLNWREKSRLTEVWLLKQQ